MASFTELLLLMLLPFGARGVPDGKQPREAASGAEGGVQPVAVRVHCTESSMVVRAHADLYGTGRLVTAGELRLGPDSTVGNCGAVQREDNDLVITAGLQECGAKLWVDDDSLIYANTLFHTPNVNRFGMVRTAGVAIPLQCRYKRTHLVSSSSGSQAALWSSAPAEGVFSPEISSRRFLMCGSDYLMSERSLDMSKPDEVISMVASVLSTRHSALKLFLDRCEATLEPDTAATPTCDLLNDHWSEPHPTPHG